jgi:hypothetical protein
MENKNQPAYPVIEETTDRIDEGMKIYSGLSKREKIAAKALQWLLANPDYNCPSDPKKLPTTTSFAKAALHYADALLAELEKPQQ